jgi:tetratricopeptide (TPR) repeat protein
MYHKALETHPDDPLLAFLLGMLYFRLEMIDEALNEFKKLESAVPEASPVHLFLASIHERRGETDLAFQEYGRAFEQEKFSFFGYRCDYCKQVASEWAGTCPGCGRRNTYAIYWNTGDVNLVPFSEAPQ